MMKVFWSWQDDLEASRHRSFIKQCIQGALETASEELGLDEADRPELDHDTKGEPGMVDIPATILRKISEAAVFIADVTPIAETTGSKALPNPNVMIELGWAMREPGYERIIAVFNAAEGWTPERLPFDIRHRRPMQYSLPEGASQTDIRKAQKRLTKELADAIRLNIGESVEAEAETAELPQVAHDNDDPSIWPVKGGVIEHADTLGIQRKSRVYIASLPRAFIRVIPGGWKSGIPSVYEIENLGTSVRPSPATEGGSLGNHGPFADGFLSYWITGQTADGEPESANVACFFDETGEFWIIHGTAIGSEKFGPTLHPGKLLGGWSRAIRQAFATFDHFDALDARRIELGLVGINDVRWPGDFEYNSPVSRKGEMNCVRQSRNWSPNDVLTFLTVSYNEVLNMFGLPKATGDDVAQILSIWDRDFIQTLNSK